MCNRAAQLQTAAQLAEALGAEFFNLGDGGPTLPRKRIDPHSRIPIVAGSDDGPRAMDAEWGMPFPGSTWNARDDRLETSPAWSRLVGKPRHHAVAVLSHIFEAFGKHALQAIGEKEALKAVTPDAIATARSGKSAWHGITRADAAPILVPCLTLEQNGRHYATMVTTDANAAWGRLHRPAGNPKNARQVVWLDNLAAAEQWMTAEDWPRLIRPCKIKDMAWYRVAPDGWTDGDPFTPWESGQAGLGAFG